MSGLGTTAFQDVAVPYLEQQAGVPVQSDAALQASRNQASSLNGSGPNDTKGALKAPDGMLGMILGQKIDGSGKVTQGVPWLLLGLGAVVVGFFMFRRR